MLLTSVFMAYWYRTAVFKWNLSLLHTIVLAAAGRVWNRLLLVIYISINHAFQNKVQKHILEALGQLDSTSGQLSLAELYGEYRRVVSDHSWSKRFDKNPIPHCPPNFIECCLNKFIKAQINSYMLENYMPLSEFGRCVFIMFTIHASLGGVYLDLRWWYCTERQGSYGSRCMTSFLSLYFKQSMPWRRFIILWRAVMAFFVRLLMSELSWLGANTSSGIWGWTW